ncbi:MAG: uncharacterized protein JWN37_706 [Candidatus Nomurabacteria bacterium]|nr:uncharacterized protein [Candidatus Nomurabacteria bacterium]
MKEDPLYRPHISTDKKYIKDVGELIKNDNKENIDFEILNNIFKLLNITDDFLFQINLENLNSEIIKENINKAFNAINTTEVKEELLSALYKAWDYLSESDPLEKADLIFVFGGAGIDRVNEAINLYKGGYAPHLLFTGQKASYMEDDDISEAEYYEKLAIKGGVPASAIILEKEAKNTPENVVNSYRILKEKDMLPSKVIIITLPYHMRRAYFTFKAGASRNPKVIRHTVPSSKYTRENYFKSEEGFNYICFEFIKIYGARLMGHF